MKQRISILFLLTAFMVQVPLAAMDSTTYFQIEIETLRLTKEELIKQLACLQTQSCTTDRQLQIAEENMQKKEQLYKTYNTSPAEHLLYYTQHRHDLDPLYMSGPYAEQLQDLKDEIASLMEQIDTLKEER